MAVQRVCNEFRPRRPSAGADGHSMKQPTPFYRSRLRSASMLPSRPACSIWDSRHRARRVGSVRKGGIHDDFQNSRDAHDAGRCHRGGGVRPGEITNETKRGGAPSTIAGLRARSHCRDCCNNRTPDADRSHVPRMDLFHTYSQPDRVQSSEPGLPYRRHSTASGSPRDLHVLGVRPRIWRLYRQRTPDSHRPLQRSALRVNRCAVRVRVIPWLLRMHPHPRVADALPTFLSRAVRHLRRPISSTESVCPDGGLSEAARRTLCSTCPPKVHQRPTTAQHWATHREGRIRKFAQQTGQGNTSRHSPDNCRRIPPFRTSLRSRLQRTKRELRLGKPCEGCHAVTRSAQAGQRPTAMSDERFVYVLRSVADPSRHDVGVTSHPSTRVTSHNAGESPHTAKHRPWRLLATMEFASEALALKFERYLESGSGRAFARRHFG